MSLSSWIVPKYKYPIHVERPQNYLFFSHYITRGSRDHKRLGPSDRVKDWTFFGTPCISIGFVSIFKVLILLYSLNWLPDNSGLSTKTFLRYSQNKLCNILSQLKTSLRKLTKLNCSILHFFPGKFMEKSLIKLLLNLC